jgi:hypothetical protein
MNAVTHPMPPQAPPAAEPIPLYPGPEMVPVALARVEPLPPPPKQATRSAAVRAGTVIAGIGSLVALVGLFLVPWFQVDEIAASAQQPPAAVTSQPGNQSGQGGTQTFSGFRTFTVMREMHEYGVTSWASTRRQKQDIAIVALVMAMGVLTLVGALVWRWRLCIALAGLAALGAFLLTLLDYQRLDGLIRQRLLAATTISSAVNLKISGAQPGTGMIAVLAGLLIALFGILIALLSGRRGKLLTPLQQ